MPPRRKPAAADNEPAAALPGVMEARRRRRRRMRRSRRRRSRSRRRRSRSRSRSRSQSQPEAMSSSPSPSSRASSAAASPVRRKTRTSKYGNVNPFINFMASERSRMGGSGGRPASEVTKELGARWRAMGMEERQPYIAQAIKSREELERINTTSKIVEARRRRRRRMTRRRRSRSRSRRRRSRSRRRR